MTGDHDHEDVRIGRLLRAVRADADPALWTRVRARIEARRSLPALLAFAMRPAALAASFALLVASASLAIVLGTGGTGTVGEGYESVADALLAERDAAQTTAPATPFKPDRAARDSGGAE